MLLAHSWGTVRQICVKDGPLHPPLAAWNPCP